MDANALHKVTLVVCTVSEPGFRSIAVVWDNCGLNEGPQAMAFHYQRLGQTSWLRRISAGGYRNRIILYPPLHIRL